MTIAEGGEYVPILEFKRSIDRCIKLVMSRGSDVTDKIHLENIDLIKTAGVRARIRDEKITLDRCLRTIENLRGQLNG